MRVLILKREAIAAVIVANRINLSPCCLIPFTRLASDDRRRKDNGVQLNIGDSDQFGVIGTAQAKHKRNYRPPQRRKWNTGSQQNQPVNSTFPLPATSSRVLGSQAVAKSLRRGQFSDHLQESDTFGSLSPEAASVEQSFNRRALKQREKFGMLPVTEEEEDEEKYGETQWLDDESDVGIEFIPFIRRHHPKWYIEQCHRLARAGKMAECVAMLETRMLKEDKIKPTTSNFSVVIGHLGRRGYTKKAFELYELMQTRYKQLTVSSAIYKSLFNACATCPFCELGLQRARALRNQLCNEGHVMDIQTYNVMIKAFAMQGEVNEALAVVDDMRQQGYHIRHDTFSFLLTACISDKEGGFRRAIELWRKFLRQKGLPHIYCYNLLLRACRDCGIGDTETINGLLNTRSLPKPHQREQTRRDRNILSNSVASLPGHHSSSQVALKIPIASDLSKLEPHYYMSDSVDSSNNRIAGTWEITVECKHDESSSGYMQPESSPVGRSTTAAASADPQTSGTTNSNSVAMVDAHHVGTCDDEITTPATKAFLQPLPFKNHILNPKYRPPPGLVSLAPIESPQDRFALIGGLSGIFGSMKYHQVTPDVKTFSLCLDLIDNNEQSERQLLDTMKELKVKPDTDFFNLLIKRRSFRRDQEASLQILNMIRENGLLPNQMTFGCLALSCRNLKDALQLLRDMKSMEIKLNNPIAGSLVNNAVCGYNPVYLTTVLQSIEKAELHPSKHLLTIIENRIGHLKEKALLADAGTPELDGYFKSDLYRESYQKFEIFYRGWLKRVTVEKKEHPWMELSKPVKSDDLRKDWEKQWKKDQDRNIDNETVLTADTYADIKQ